jgi:hypothetical protein
MPLRFPISSTAVAMGAGLLAGLATVMVLASRRAQAKELGGTPVGQGRIPQMGGKAGKVRIPPRPIPPVIDGIADVAERMRGGVEPG